MTDCFICNKSIHLEHTEGELMKCLVTSGIYHNVITEFINKWRNLNA